ncbi:MAG: FAD:protein FMN transferase [Myxococcales bacterium]|nr:FAD:protein FMN transferase [Myxococcales bacterium]
MLLFFTIRVMWCSAPARVLLGGETMGTTWAVTLNAPDLPRAERTRVRERIQTELDAVNGAMSTWAPDSELSRFNAHASLESFALSKPTLEVLAAARGVSERTGGAFDVTVGPLVAAWGFGAGARVPGAGPDAAELAEIRERVGFERLELDPATGTARKRHSGVRVDLSAIAKGHGVDRVADALLADGFGDFLVEVGGEVRAHGERPGGGGWRLAIERPEPDGRAVHAVVELSGMALATSGDYRAFYEAAGERVTHIVDPRVGRPVSHGLASVSVLHERAALADAWATALTVLGPEEGLRVAEAEGLAVYLIVRGESGAYEIRTTPAFPPVSSPRDASVSGD